MSQFACKEFSALDKELKDDLIECYVEAQQEIDAIINDIEAEGFEFAKLDKLFRSLHSMKGNCSVCFLDPIVEVLHKLEEIVDGMRGGYIAYDSTLGELINSVIENVLHLIRQLYQFHGADTKLKDTLQIHLDEIYAQEELELRQQLATRLVNVLNHVEDVPEEPAKPIINQLEYTESQQQDIDQFRQFSQRLNRLLGYSPERSERILKLCLLINAECSTPVDPVQLSAAAYMHNMGLAMILKCQGDAAAEAQARANHPLVGAQLLAKHSGWEMAAEMVSCHEERFDGSGFPEGLVGGTIPNGAVILAMAVLFIDFVWGKSGDEYKKSAMKAIQKINSESGKGFPPHSIDFFNRAIRKLLVAKKR
ncbi:phosphohydrolase [Maribrevibacterium harenarium]|uniref:Phosphohydrolase n=1 Tax=Maribrevibacterium harenarium TaxID=2589817 RepID=A0A501WKM0_9GAMM|nr:HD domain-containing phosphohydrolase [Maribrevibacterium harenarium]TPE47601.1 phosphohydrolase [Maribrevibacterium harenarium]